MNQDVEEGKRKVEVWWKKIYAAGVLGEPGKDLQHQHFHKHQHFHTNTNTFTQTEHIYGEHFHKRRACRVQRVDTSSPYA